MNIELSQITIPGSESVFIHLRDVDVGKMPPQRIKDYIEQVRVAFELDNPVLQRLNLNSIPWKVLVSAKRR